MPWEAAISRLADLSRERHAARGEEQRHLDRLWAPIRSGTVRRLSEGARSVESEAGLEERLTLHAVLAGVAEPLREIAVYYYLDQMSHEEIARLLGVSRRTVGNRLVEFHAAAKLAAQARRICP